MGSGEVLSVRTSSTFDREVVPLPLLPSAVKLHHRIPGTGELDRCVCGQLADDRIAHEDVRPVLRKPVARVRAVLREIYRPGNMAGAIIRFAAYVHDGHLTVFHRS